MTRFAQRTADAALVVAFLNTYDTETGRDSIADQSRNRSRSWCSMETCGNRAKARSFRSRARINSD